MLKMKVLVANLGSTSFKYRLFDLPSEKQLARGGIDRIGQPSSNCFAEIESPSGGTHREELKTRVADHAEAVRICLDQLTNPNGGCLTSVAEVAAIGFKAVFAGRLSGVRLVDENLLTTMEALSDVAPAHNPPYARAMRELKQAFPEIPLVAALETGFHETIAEENRIYAVPYEWKVEHDIQRWGFHGASHRYIGGRIGEILGRHDLRVISCHLGGSNSLCAICCGKSVGTSMGLSPQTGLPHNNRVGDLDPFSLPILMKATGKSLEAARGPCGKKWSLRNQRPERRCAGPRRSSGERSRASQFGAQCVRRRRFAITSERTWSCSAVPMRSSLRAASARTAAVCVAMCAATWNGPACGSMPSAMKRLRASRGFRPTRAVSKCGSFPRTKN